jgi:hypothetical protein
VTRIAVTRDWLFSGLDWYQSLALELYLPHYMRDDCWQ